MEPLIGAAGKLVRAGVHRWKRGGPPPDFEAERAMGAEVFFSNTVPYKPVGNKAWSVKVKRRFAPMIQHLIAHHWTGSDLICCGNVAFHWFGMVDKALKPALDVHWQLDDRYERPLSIEFAGRKLRLHPLPHPSPLNARWYPHFPALMDACLTRVGWA